jgi:AraC family transcriptional regulator
MPCEKPISKFSLGSANRSQPAKRGRAGDDRLLPGTNGSAFAEAPAWNTVSSGWRPLFGSFPDLGFSFEWHDFQSGEELDWARSFHPGGIELCLNLSGTALLDDGKERHSLNSRSLAFYHQGDPALRATRAAHERHQFLTVEYSGSFLARHLGEQAHELHRLVRDVVEGKNSPSQVMVLAGSGVELLQLTEGLRHPPVFAPARRIWFASRALELAARFFFLPAEGELFCSRAKRTGRERVQRAQAILRDRLREPPTLEELAREMGCSHFYLSRIFSQEAGMTIQQYLRHVRLERAAELLRTGRCNVTEAAFEVGYNSLSHFSTAFHQTFGCCPGLYPIRSSSQRELKKTSR